MLRSCLQFFKCNENQEVNENSLLFPKKLLMEVDREIKYRQKYLILCTLITGTLAVAGTSAGLGLLFQFEKNNVTELANANPNNKLDNADYHVHQITLYLGLPTVSLAILGLEFSCMYHALKKYFKYPENAPVTDLSPALLEKVKDFLRTIQYSIDYLTLSDVREILSQEANRNSVNEPLSFYYSIPEL